MTIFIDGIEQKEGESVDVRSLREVRIDDLEEAIRKHREAIDSEVLSYFDKLMNHDIIATFSI